MSQVGSTGAGCEDIGWFIGWLKKCISIPIWEHNGMANVSMATVQAAQRRSQAPQSRVCWVWCNPWITKTWLISYLSYPKNRVLIGILLGCPQKSFLKFLQKIAKQNSSLQEERPALHGWWSVGHSCSRLKYFWSTHRCWAFDVLKNLQGLINGHLGEILRVGCKIAIFHDKKKCWERIRCFKISMPRLPQLQPSAEWALRPEGYCCTSSQ